MLLNERELEGGEGLVFVDVAESRHEWTDHELGVIAEVDLQIEGVREGVSK